MKFFLRRVPVINAGTIFQPDGNFKLRAITLTNRNRESTETSAERT